MGEMETEGHVVELEFDVTNAEVFIVEASRKAECEITLHEMVQRSDGSILEFMTVSGTDPEQLIELAENADDILEARLVSENDTECLFEFIIDESRVTAALADNESIFKRISATAGEGRLIAEVPPHVNPTAVIETFLSNHPNAELVARRTSSQTAPLFTEHEFRTLLLTQLTDKQLEALRVAYANGYFERPRRCNTADIAEILGVSSPTVSQHVRVAQQKMFETLFNG